LITTHLENLFDKSGAPQRIKENRHALHVSDASDFNTIHAKMRRDDGGQIDKHLLTAAIRDGRFQPIYVRSVMHPSALPQLTLPVNGSVVRLPTYNPDLCTMHYALWFTSAEAWRRLNLQVPYSIAWSEFRRFVVFLPFCYAAGPSPLTSRTIDYTTTSEEMRSAEHIALGNRVGPAEGAPAPAVVGYVVRDFNRMIFETSTASGLRPDLGPLVPQVARFLAKPVL
jgi:hypothetical protein